MGRCIVKLADNEYIEWSLIVDAPVSNIMTRDKMIKYFTSGGDIQTKLESSEHIESRLDRADKHGTSDFTIRETTEQFLSSNRAGPNESRLSLEEIRKQYRQEKEKPKSGINQMNKNRRDQLKTLAQNASATGGFGMKLMRVEPRDILQLISEVEGVDKKPVIKVPDKDPDNSIPLCTYCLLDKAAPLHNVGSGKFSHTFFPRKNEKEKPKGGKWNHDLKALIKTDTNISVTSHELAQLIAIAEKVDQCEASCGCNSCYSKEFMAEAEKDDEPCKHLNRTQSDGDDRLDFCPDCHNYMARLDKPKTVKEQIISLLYQWNNRPTDGYESDLAFSALAEAVEWIASGRMHPNSPKGSWPDVALDNIYDILQEKKTKEIPEQ